MGLEYCTVDKGFLRDKGRQDAQRETNSLSSKALSCDGETSKTKQNKTPPLSRI